MAEGPLGEFYVRYPDGRRLHVNDPRDQLLVGIPCHGHATAHTRILFANDTPGPLELINKFFVKIGKPHLVNGNYRVGWYERIWKNRADFEAGLSPLEEGHVRANGPDSPRNIPANQWHEFTLLSMQGYHLCFHFNWEEDEDGLRRVPYYTGHLGPTS